MDNQQNIIIYRTAEGRASVALYAKDGKYGLTSSRWQNFCHLEAQYKYAYC